MVGTYGGAEDLVLRAVGDLDVRVAQARVVGGLVGQGAIDPSSPHPSHHTGSVIRGEEEGRKPASTRRACCVGVCLPSVWPTDEYVPTLSLDAEMMVRPRRPDTLRRFITLRSWGRQAGRQAQRAYHLAAGPALRKSASDPGPAPAKQQEVVVVVLLTTMSLRMGMTRREG